MHDSRFFSWNFAAILMIDKIGLVLLGGKREVRLSGCGCDGWVVRIFLEGRIWRSLGGKGGWGRIDIRHGGLMLRGYLWGVPCGMGEDVS